MSKLPLPTSKGPPTCGGIPRRSDAFKSQAESKANGRPGQTGGFRPQAESTARRVLPGADPGETGESETGEVEARGPRTGEPETGSTVLGVSRISRGSKPRADESKTRKLPCAPKTSKTGKAETASMVSGISRISRPSKREERSVASGVPKAGGTSMVSNVAPADSAVLGKGKTKGKKKSAKEIDYLLPALSVFKPAPKDTKAIEKMKKEMIRRNAPQGEDLKKIREVLKGIKGEEITVHEFVGLVAPYTADNGTVLRRTLANELTCFRTMARKVYDTMSRDVSDVLMNEHIQLTEASREKHAHYTDKMMRSIDEIYEYAPNFAFERYYTDSDYLKELFPLAKEAVISEDERQDQLRQEAYHRLMWLRSEGERLAEENRRLQARLHELKNRQRQEMVRATEIEREYEQKRLELEKTQTDLEDQLDHMNQSVERSMVQEEKDIREDVPHLKPLPEPQIRAPHHGRKMKVRKPENWNVKTAVEIEEKTTSEALIAEASRVSVAASKSATSAAAKKKIKKKMKFKKKEEYTPPSAPRQAGPTSPFHYSPPRTPPEFRMPQQQRSPFHYSPPKTPPEFRGATRQMSPSRAAPPDVETFRIQASSTTRESARALPEARRSLAPRDSWSGFR